MLATASKARDDRLSVGATKLPAALLISPVSPPDCQQRLDHLLHALRVADVDAEGVDAPPGELRAPFGGRLFDDRLAPAADRDVGAQRQKALGHRPAEAGAAAGHEDALAGHQIGLVHGCLLATHWLCRVPGQCPTGCRRCARARPRCAPCRAARRRRAAAPRRAGGASSMPGWMTSVRVSPMLARWLMNCAASMKLDARRLDAAATDAERSSERPAPSTRASAAATSACCGWSASPG